jgi:putative chitinase
MITTEQIAAACGTSTAHADLWCDALNVAMAQFSINTPARQAAFLAQIAHESARLSAVQENLNYGAAGLEVTFPREFATEEAQTYARHPEAIANRAYAGKNGNGDEASGDGWNYRGRGLIMTTGRANYLHCRDKLTELLGASVPDFIEQPDQVATPQWGAMCAGLFWLQTNCNALADAGNFDAITRAINGPAMAGSADRQALWAGSKTALGI